LFKPVQLVAIGRQLIIAVDNGNGVLFHPFYNTPAVLNKYFGIEW
jgi:hypothetical protein